jgi:hypothetical protein
MWGIAGWGMLRMQTDGHKWEVAREGTLRGTNEFCSGSAVSVGSAAAILD